MTVVVGLLERGRIGVMWEKLRVVFTIPELRQKILLTLIFLAIYRVGYWIPLPIINQAKLQAGRTRAAADLADIINQVAVFSASDLTPGDDLRPGDHALYFGFDYLPVAGQRLEADRGTEEGR